MSGRLRDLFQRLSPTPTVSLPARPPSQAHTVPSSFLHFTDAAWVTVDSGFPSSSTGSTTNRVTVLTWNVWFSERAQDLRHSALLNRVLDPALGVDIACFQEVTAAFWDILRAHPSIRSDWIISDWSQQANKNWYGTAMIIRRAWLAARGPGPALDVECTIHPYHKTVLARQLLVAQLSRNGVPLLTVATTHLEHPADSDTRKGQMFIALNFFQPDVPTVWCGDTNVYSYDELFPMLENGFVDTLRAACTDAFKADDTSPETLYTTMPTRGITYPHSKSPRRIDHVLARHAVILAAGQVGKERIPNSEEYPSDHIGVYAVLQLPSS
ncbi:DNase I-like protein [Exidia glandulosa HHB12029]|uniref:DNase I-like protein n=1 Tax=Exidia glandulosa HHB12029 TaxID=1314781 RepID=A0A165JAM5_EXIGL|nr:DNase I-like protein [Exidia glandulosa HHB12029]